MVSYIVGYVARMVSIRNTYRILVGKPGGKRPRGRRGHKWKDNIKMDLKGSGHEDVD